MLLLSVIEVITFFLLLISVRPSLHGFGGQSVNRSISSPHHSRRMPFKILEWIELNYRPAFSSYIFAPISKRLNGLEYISRSSISRKEIRLRSRKTQNSYEIYLESIRSWLQAQQHRTDGFEFSINLHKIVFLHIAIESKLMNLVS